MPDIRRGRAADMGQGRQSGEGRRRRAEKAGARPKEVRRQEGRRGKAAQRKEIDKDTGQSKLPLTRGCTSRGAGRLIRATRQILYARCALCLGPLHSAESLRHRGSKPDLLIVSPSAPSSERRPAGRRQFAASCLFASSPWEPLPILR